MDQRKSLEKFRNFNLMKMQLTKFDAAKAVIRGMFMSLNTYILEAKKYLKSRI